VGCSQSSNPLSHKTGPLARLKRTVVLAGVVCVTIVAYAPAQDQPASTQTEVVGGTVVNAVTQEPVSRALVTSTDERFAALTDSSGHFEFAVPKEQSQATTDTNTGLHRFDFASRREGLWLSARKPGFLNEQDTQPYLRSVAGKDNIIALVPEALIKGRISLSTGEPASGVTIQLYSRQVLSGFPKWVPGKTGRTNTSGEFRFAELAGGAYKLATLEFSDSDPQVNGPADDTFVFPPAYYPGVSDFNAGANINASAGQMVEANLTLTLQRYYQIQIPVASAEPNIGLNVSVQGQHGPGFALGYNAAERRIEGSLPNGNYIVQATTYNPPSSSGSVTLNVQGGPTEGPVLSLARDATIPVEVKEEFNDKMWNGSMTMSIGARSFSVNGPRRYLSVYAENADESSSHPRGGALRPPTGPNDNALMLENLSPGSYWVHLDTSRGYVASAISGNIDLLREPLRVVSAANSPIEVTLRDDGASIDGTIANWSEWSSKVGPGATAYLIPLPDSPGQFQQRGIVDGKFELSILAPGSYRVLAVARPLRNLPYRDPESMKAYETKGQVIRAVAGQKLTVQVPLISSSDETGQVK